MDRPVFLRETLNKSYTVSAFFIAKNICIGFIEVCGYFAGSSYGLLISVFVPKVEMAMALFPALVVPSMIFAGYLVNQSNIPYYFYEIEYISPFRYLFMANAIVRNFIEIIKKLSFFQRIIILIISLIVILLVIHWLS